MRPAVALSLAAVVLTACASEPSPDPRRGTDPERTVAAQEHEPYTSTYEVEVAGEAVGYLVSYDAVPLHALGEVDRTLPTGTHRIQNTGFVDIGFISPMGEVRRYAGEEAPRSLGTRDGLEDGLSLFFDGRSPVKLRRLEIGGPAKVD